MKLSLTSLPALAAVAASALLGHLVVGCSADGSILPPEEAPPSDEGLQDAGAASDADAAPAPDGSSCDDCAFFLPACEPGSFCPIDTSKLDLAGTVSFRAMSGTSDSDVWVLGTKATILHHDGAAWSKVDAPDAPLTRIASHADGTVWTAATLPKLFIRAPGDGSEWSTPTLDPDPGGFSGEAYADVSAMWTATDARWTWLSIRDDVAVIPKPNSFHLRRLRKSDDAYVNHEPFHCELVPLRQATCPMFLGLHGSSKDDLWAVGEAGTAYRIVAADTDWPTLAVHDSRTFATLHGVWSGEYGDAWAVGGQGTIRHYTGSVERRFEYVESPVTTTLRAIWGSSKTDIWAVGDAGVVLHYDGATWSRVPLGGVAGKPDLFAVWAASPSRVWAAGEGVLLQLSVKGGS